MRYFLAALVLFVSASIEAQEVTLRDGDRSASARAIRRVVASPHSTIRGSGRFDIPRDSVIAGSLLVVGRPTYLAGTVHGDVVVVGSDLFLRPGVVIDGRAVAIGGTVATTSLGSVKGGSESLRDETFVADNASAPLSLRYQDLRVEPTESTFELAGLQGFLLPAYDRVDGLSLPIGAEVHLADGLLDIYPRLTYRSRLGVVDPAADLLFLQERAVRLELHGARDTRSNEKWNYSDFVNTAVALFTGGDTRNYFRSDIGEGRTILRNGSSGFVLESWLGGRFENVSPISATGDVYSFIGRSDSLKTRRFNPPVQSGHIGSGLLGARMFDTAGVVISRFSAEAEQSFTTMRRTSSFTQLTLDGKIGFPTFGTQELHFRGHAVITRGDTVPRARYAYIGGSGTLPVLRLLEQGGDQFVFLESRYVIPVAAVKLPLVGNPVVTLSHFMGAAGVGSLPSLEQELGIGIGLSVLRLDYAIDANHSRGSKISFGISL